MQACIYCKDKHHSSYICDEKRAADRLSSKPANVAPEYPPVDPVRESEPVKLTPESKQANKPAKQSEPLSQQERNKRWRDKNAESYKEKRAEYMRAYRAKKSPPT